MFATGFQNMSSECSIILQHGIVSEVPIWNIENSSSINLGLMYFNDDKLKNKLINEYKKTQKFRRKNFIWGN